MAYLNSKYYDKQAEILDNDKLTKEQKYERMLVILEEELAHPDIYSDWIVSHYGSAAEYLVENSYCCHLVEELGEIPEMVRLAKREIEVFKKYDREMAARFMEECLKEFFGNIDSGFFEEGVRQREDDWMSVNKKYHPDKDFTKPNDEEIHKAVMELAAQLAPMRA